MKTMKTTNIQRIRFCRIPLLLGLIVSGLMIARVPLNAFTSKPSNGQPSVAAGKKPAVEAAEQHETAAAEVVLEQPLEVVATELSGEAETEDAVGLTLSLPGIELSDAQQLLQQNKGMVGELLSALPSAADLIPRSSTPSNEEPSQAETSPVEEPTTDVEPQVVLRNPVESGGSIRFLIGDQLHDLQSGDQLAFAAGKQIRLRFHRGESFGNAEHMLTTAGHYEFVPTEQGWVLSTVE